MRISIQIQKTTMAILVTIGLFAVSSIAQASTYDSCIDAYEHSNHESGQYSIENIGNVYCDMSTDGGIWLGVTPNIAKDELNGTLNITDGDSNTESGIDSYGRPHTRDGNGAHTATYTFRLPFTSKTFFLRDYTAKSNAASGDATDIFKQRFIQSSWSEAHDRSVGDIAFGFVNSGPVTSFAKELGSGDGSCNNVDDNGYCVARNQIIAWPNNNEVYTAGASDNDFRIGWGDEGTPSEGWFPWWGGMIMIREGDRPRDDIKIDIRSINIENDNDVEFNSRITGDPEDKDAKISVDYEDNEGGDCDGDWEDAHIKGGARATNDDTDGDPDVDNGNSYQIGSRSHTRVIADGSSNTVRFKWDAERDLGNNLHGRYCVRIKVRADSGESDTDTYIVDFGTPHVDPVPAPIGSVTVTAPINNIAITTPNPAIIGTGVAGNTILVRSVGRTCTATVMSGGGWTCTLTGLQPGTYSVVANQYTQDGIPNGVATGSFMIVQTAMPTPQPGGLCQQHITSYMKLGQYNDQSQVRKLQEYLNTREAEHLAVTGTFDYTTEAAVKRYQAKYAQDILYPWGMRAPSGYVYKTTINHINRQLCSGQVQCPVFTQYHKLGQSGGEIAKIQTFLRQYGYYRGASTGYFDRATDIGIKAFQEEFRPMVLTPWRLPAPTGNWYKTSRKHANWLNGCYERVTLEGMGVTF